MKYQSISVPFEHPYTPDGLQVQLRGPCTGARTHEIDNVVGLTYSVGRGTLIGHDVQILQMAGYLLCNLYVLVHSGCAGHNQGSARDCQ